MTEDVRLRDTVSGPVFLFAAFLVTVFPTVALVAESLSDTVFLTLGIAGFLLTARSTRISPLTKDEKLLFFVVSFFVLVAGFAFLTGPLTLPGWNTLANYLRFLLLLPIYLIVRRMPSRPLVLWPGICLGALVSPVVALYGLPPGTGEFPFAGVALALGFVALGSVGTWIRVHPALILIPMAGALAGTYAALAAGNPGIWIAIPALLVLAVPMLRGQLGVRAGRGAVGILMPAMLVVFFLPGHEAGSRILETAVAIPSFLAGRTALGDLGIHRAMWEQAATLFLDSPVFGAGLEAFRETGPYAHPHSAYLSLLASRGVLGLLSLVLVFAVPLRHLVWAAGHRDRQMRSFAYGGNILIVAYAHYALTQPVFDMPVAITFYVFGLSVVYAFLRVREKEYLSEPIRRRKSLSVIVIAMDEADRIRPCLESVHGWADEIIVLDSGSRDGTPDICREYTDKVFVTDWPGFGPQKQRALDKATGDWVLSIDADERVSPELRSNIDHELAAEPRFVGFEVHRPVHIFGRHLDFSGSGQAPLRLFRRDVARFTQVPVHEKVVVSRGRIGRLRGWLLHVTYRDYLHAVNKFAEYAWLQGRARFEKGRRSGLVSASFRAVLNFIHNYVFRLGFLDGSRGFAMAVLHAQYTFNKYAVLWMLSLNPQARHNRSDLDKRADE